MDTQEKNDCCTGGCPKDWPESSNNPDGSIPPFHLSVNVAKEKVLTRTDKIMHRELYEVATEKHVCELDSETKAKLDAVIEKYYDPAKCKCTHPYTSDKPKACACTLQKRARTMYQLPRTRGVYPNPFHGCDHCYKITEAAIAAVYGPTTIQEVMIELRALQEEVKALRGRVAELESSHEDLAPLESYSVMLSRAPR